MSEYKILYDEPQEAEWFKSLHSSLHDAEEEPITEAQKKPNVHKVLAYDRPDIMLLHNDRPILVVEETVEVPSGHNVGQRFARIAAAAEQQVPCLYFGPYVAKKHGGATAGPRYINLRLFHAIDAMIRTTGTAITTINWPVDKHCEVRRDKDKDHDVRQYMAEFFSDYQKYGMKGINKAILNSSIQKQMDAERKDFILNRVKNPEQYDQPPESVEILAYEKFLSRLKIKAPTFLKEIDDVVLYNVGMKYIRSDPYTGMAMLYKYLYIAEFLNRALVLWFPNITRAMWNEAAKKANRKDIRLFKIVGDGVLFSDGLVGKGEL